MKFAGTTLMSLLLLGVCYARSLDTSRPQKMEDNMKPKDVDYWKAAQDSRREGAQNKAEEQNVQKWTHFRETGYQKLGNLNQHMTSSGNNLPIDNLPQLADPIHVGNVVSQFAMLSINYENVLFLGLHGVHDAAISVDTGAREATLTVSLKTAEIRGNFAVTDQMKRIAGTFNIQMGGDVSYVCTYHYQQNGNNVQLLHSGGKLNYGRPVSQYENADFPDFVRNDMQAPLLQKVNEKIYAELNSKMNGRVHQYIQEVVQGHHQQEPVEKLMRDDVQNVINEILQSVSKYRFSSIHLTSADQEIMYNKLHAKIASVSLNGAERLYLANKQVSNENSDKVCATLQLAIDRPTATAVVNIHQTHEENAPFQKINVDFDIDQLMTEIRYEKAARQSGLDMSSFKVKVKRIRPVGIEKFEREVRNLIKEKLADHMKDYLEYSLNQFILNEYLATKTQGVLPPSQEKRSASSLI